MTIFEPNSDRFRIDILLTVLIAAVAAGIFYAIYLYQGMVRFRHELSANEEAMIRFEEESAELRHQLYNTLDADQLLKDAENKGFTIDRKPKYLKPKASVVAQDL